MEYRELGRTGIKVSVIALGCEGFVANEGALTEQLLNAAEQGGINCIDLYAPQPEMRSRLGKWLRGRRGKFVLQAHLCTVWQEGQYKRTREIGEVKASFEDLLTRLATDYIDIGMIHYVDSLEDWEAVAGGPVMAYAREMQAQGKIRYIGLSSHNPAAAMQSVQSGLIDVLMFSVNPCYDLQPANEDCYALWDGKNYDRQLVNMDPEREALYETCSRLGVAITVMKAFGGGDLLDEELSPAGKALTVNQCLHYALTRPGVAAVMSGAHTVDELEKCLEYTTAADVEKDYAAAFAALPKISWEGHCMYCGHCAPCPQGIDVAAVTKFLNLTKAQNSVPETVREHYAALRHHAGECVKCGACEKRCPFKVTVIQNMQEAVKVFGM
ncbi:aldo/keto reductase [Phascolarctobacterium faecium]|uniref:Aldo/keto reductase n=1 Tax=Phascolarctobacterium faecium TaxID=33025 RepID=A0A7X2XF58_9FIRM|nr:aldo/keto reductase [Phascolarctobacterium faecium]MTS80809.1 aldo/keto reductase [Phascolarctobacterium faecium]MTT02038.1 aldo/keto reductase [Phascolarctobacterium faecium]MTT16123.1 aldo/keto reductase [Phascolarctobacterium faecium]MTT34221.1 aldo/keto reductase [Phascolarctobacterium faecium]MTT49510.1 aldo/keto reductase [Phascolarctobacterium faecium]